ncbi:MAG: dihydroorotase [Ruminococcaceae bacterium]|nr:dihydroorotase [Oscillospiraceae bacterium]
MNYILKNGYVFNNGSFDRCDVLLSDGLVKTVSSSIFDSTAQVFDFTNKFIFPGFADVHVHLREPGFIYKETIKTGTLAAAHGGYTTVCSMPNLSPTPDSLENLKLQLDAIKNDAVVEVLPFGTITVGEKGETLAELDEMAPFVCGYSDDGRGVQNEKLMLLAMSKAKKLGKIISAHCEVNSLLNGGYIHDGEYAKKNSHKGISSESEYAQVKRDIELVKETGVSYHVCHVSTKESVEAIRQAKKEGVDITCETGPHYLVLCDEDLIEDGRFKMNPPLRSRQDKEALIEGIKDGTVDMIATDHAPHSHEEKSKGLKDSLMGVVGLETAFSVLYTKLVLTKIISLEKLVELMSINPRKRFNIDGGLEVGKRADVTVFDLEKEYIINPEEFLSKGRSTPFKDLSVFGKCIMTIYGGKIVWQKK